MQYLRGCSVNKRFNSAYPMTANLWCFDRKTGSPSCCFNSVPSEQQDRGSVSAASQWAALLTRYHHKITPRLADHWQLQFRREVWIVKLPLMTVLCSWPDLSLKYPVLKPNLLYCIKERKVLCLHMYRKCWLKTMGTPEGPLWASIQPFIVSNILPWNTQLHAGKLSYLWPWIVKCKCPKWIPGQRDGCAFHPQLSLIN